MTAADVYRALWRHKLLIAVLTLVAVGATVYYTSRESKTYEASTLIRVQLRGGSSGDAFNVLEASQRLAQTYAQVIDSGALTDQIRRRVTSETLRRRISDIKISAQPVQDTELMWISAQGRHPIEAAASADAAPSALRDFIRKTGGPADQVVTVKAATVPTSPVAPRLRLNVLLALLLGLIFNGALALLIELLRDRMPETETLGASLGYPVLTTIPTLLRHRRRSPAPEPSRRGAQHRVGAGTDGGR